MPLLNYSEPSKSLRNVLRDSPARFKFNFLTYMARPRSEKEPLLILKFPEILNILKPEAVLIQT